MKRTEIFSDDNKPNENQKYGGLWFCKFADGTEKNINCKKDYNIMCKISVFRKDHGPCVEFYKYLS